MPELGPVAALQRVTVRYGAGAPALDGIDLELRRGEIIGIVGESGAGKSTLLRLLDADETPSAGRVLIEGADPSGMRERERRALRRRIGMVFQSFNLLANRTARQNVELPLRLQRRRDPAFVDELLDYVGLSDRGSAYPAQLSGGQKQRVAIARALVTRPPLLLCDEPTSALDERTTSDILRLLASTRDDFGTTIALVTHELAAVKAICDRAAILDKGWLQGIVTVEHSARDDRGSYVEHAKRVLGS
ncbi:ATP-binding cassette domain-containing protein [Pseudoclavibacter sp. RFBA6]|uniref:ATP-binding cassette domain-containing protein n=1 Tax=Pseudoclavibacter sp. RFBA6 TaxID=2080573 RepID=UPI002157038E|nr:ATP-binding cassette domain-containing protein [Pseudoclavibacter sp. RFBA6]